jgi:capsular exopolysaccharide synthesis family protein
MSPQDSLQVIRRRLLVVIVAVIFGIVGGWVAPSGKSRGPSAFRATNTLLYEAQGRGINLEQLSLLATSGAVPSRVAVRLNMSRTDVRSAVSAVADSTVGTISITARSSEGERAVQLANVTAEELVIESGGPAQATYQAELARLTNQVDAAKDRLKNAKGPGPQAAAQNDVTVAEQALQKYQVTNSRPKPPLRTLEEATAVAVSEGVKAPTSRPLRALFLGIVGLLVGIAAAFGLDRIDSKIRSKSSAERAFGAPVVTEVPVISKSSQGELLTRTQPTSSFVEAYRGLRTYLALWAPEGAKDDGHRVLVVTSPEPGEGKTTSVAHLAAMLAEIGRSVVVVSADLRKPRVHEYFGRPASPGLVDVLSGTPGAPSFDDLDLSTSVRGVRLITSGPPIENPVPLLEHAGALIEAARGLADFVLVDTPPLLVANDAVDLARHADGVLLVTRAGKTPIEAAERSAEQLSRLGIPIAGVVLIGSEAASSKSRYYSSRYYTEPERKGRHRAPSSRNGQRPADEAAEDEASPTLTSS